MPSLKFKVDKEKFIRALLRAPEEFKEELEVEIATQMEDVKEVAGKKTSHRFKPKSGELVRSITSKKVRDFTGEVFIDDDMADYGKWIHGGFKTWEPDPFLYMAFTRKKRTIKREFQLALERAFKKSGVLMATITADNITDNILTDFADSVIDPYIARLELELISLAETFGIDSDDIATTPHNTVKEWAIAWVSMMMCFELMGTNNVETNPTIEKYAIKYQFYKDRESKLNKRITGPIIEDDVESSLDTVPITGILWRG